MMAAELEKERVVGRMKVKGTVPSLVVPSCSCNVATIVQPLTPLAVKEKFLVTAAPPAISVPYVACVLTKGLTPPELRSVAIRLAVLAEPILRKARATV